MSAFFVIYPPPLPHVRQFSHTYIMECHASRNLNINVLPDIWFYGDSKCFKKPLLPCLSINSSKSIKKVYSVMSPNMYIQLQTNKLLKNRFKLPQLVVQYVILVLQSTKSHHHSSRTYTVRKAHTPYNTLWDLLNKQIELYVWWSTCFWVSKCKLIFSLREYCYTIRTYKRPQWKLTLLVTRVQLV